MKNQKMKEVVDEICEIMKKENCRMYDSDILRALTRTTYDFSHIEGIHNIVVDTSDLVKYQ